MPSSVKLYQLPLKRFSEVALPQFIEQLKRHQVNIDKHKAKREWEKAKKEILSGQRVVTQLKAAILEMDEAGKKLPPQEETEFSRLIEPHVRRALEAIKSFTLTCQVTTELETSSQLDEASEGTNAEGKLQLYQEQFLPEEIALEQRKVQLEAYETLQKDIEELHDLFSEFAQQVHDQATPVNEIEEHVETALENVQVGERNLAKAAKYKTALYPITGALLGTCLGGPVGLLAGLKIGALAAVGGTVLGFTSGKVVKNWQEKQADAPPAMSHSQSAPSQLHSESEVLPKSSSFDVSTKDGGSVPAL